jgi:HlyD family secretion protein
VELVHKTQNRVVIALNDVKRRLAPGSVVVAQIEVERRGNALLAPNEALHYAQGRCKRKAESDCISRLWILRDGEAAAVSVRLGASDGARTEIVAGDLKAGDILIVKELD